METHIYVIDYEKRQLDLIDLCNNLCYFRIGEWKIEDKYDSCYIGWSKFSSGQNIWKVLCGKNLYYKCLGKDEIKSIDSNC